MSSYDAAKICKLVGLYLRYKDFKEVGFKIKIKTNLKIVDFLDITFNLTNGTYRPYKNPNDSLLYVNTSSNHPLQVIKQLLIFINKRLNKNSSSEEIFNETKSEYETVYIVNITWQI